MLWGIKSLTNHPEESALHKRLHSSCTPQYWVYFFSLLFCCCTAFHISVATERELCFTLPDCLARPDSRCDSWKVALFDLQGHYRQIWRHWFGVKRACHYSVVWQNSLPKGTVITSLSSFQLTPGKGIIGNHPCNAVPLSFWQLSETTALWFCRLDVKSELYTPSVPETQHAVSYVSFSHRHLFHRLYIKKFSIIDWSRSQIYRMKSRNIH